MREINAALIAISFVMLLQVARNPKLLSHHQLKEQEHRPSTHQTLEPYPWLQQGTTRATACRTEDRARQASPRRQWHLCSVPTQPTCRHRQRRQHSRTAVLLPPLSPVHSGKSPTSRNARRAFRPRRFALPAPPRRTRRPRVLLGLAP